MKYHQITVPNIKLFKLTLTFIKQSGNLGSSGISHAADLVVTSSDPPKYWCNKNQTKSKYNIIKKTSKAKQNKSPAFCTKNILARRHRLPLFSDYPTLRWYVWPIGQLSLWSCFGKCCSSFARTHRNVPSQGLNPDRSNRCRAIYEVAPPRAPTTAEAASCNNNHNDADDDKRIKIKRNWTKICD